MVESNRTAAQSPRDHSAIGWTSIAIVGFIVAAHLALTWLYNSPDNIVKIRYAQPLNSYFGRILYQNWSFFAPDPIDSDLSLLARARYRHGPVTFWINISEPLIDDLHRSRFSSYEFVATSVMNAMLAARREAPAKHRVHTSSLMTSHYYLRALYRTGASVIQHMHPAQKFDLIQIAFSELVFPRFTQRRKSDSAGVIRIHALDWQSFPQEIDTHAW